MPFCKIILVLVRGLIVSRVKLSLELLPLRQQLVILRRTVQHSQIQILDCGLTNLEGLAAGLNLRQA